MSETSRMRETGVAGGTREAGGSCCSGSCDTDLSERASRRRRIRRAFLLIAAAAGLAWLGPEWHVSRSLAVLGSAILLGFWAVTLFSRAEPGALPRRAGPGAFLVALGVLVGPWVSLREEPVAPVLVEVLLPAKAFVGRREIADAIGVSRDAWGEVAAEWSLPVLDREPFLGAIEEGRLHCVILDLRKEEARKRLGILAGRGEAIAEEEALEIDGALAFLNGAPVVGGAGGSLEGPAPSGPIRDPIDGRHGGRPSSELDQMDGTEAVPPAGVQMGGTEPVPPSGRDGGTGSVRSSGTDRLSTDGRDGARPSTKRSGVPLAFEATLEWELTREPPAPRMRIVELERGEDGAIAARILAPRRATFRLYRLEAVDNPGWWRATAILEPESIEVRIGGPGDGGGTQVPDPREIPGAVEHEVGFAEGPAAAAAAGDTVRLLVVSLEATAIGVSRIPD